MKKTEQQAMDDLAQAIRNLAARTYGPDGPRDAALKDVLQADTALTEAKNRPTLEGLLGDVSDAMDLVESTTVAAIRHPGQNREEDERKEAIEEAIDALKDLRDA